MGAFQTITEGPILMRTVRIERYDAPQNTRFAGLIEGTADDDRSWIMFLDETGMPAVYWSQRDETGGVVGGGVDLT